MVSTQSWKRMALDHYLDNHVRDGGRCYRVCNNRLCRYSFNYRAIISPLTQRRRPEILTRTSRLARIRQCLTRQRQCGEVVTDQQVA